MKYSTVIISLTLMLRSIVSERPLPFVIINETSINVFSFISMDKWENPFSNMTSSEYVSFCYRVRKAQVIYFLSSHIPEGRPLDIHIEEENNYSATINIQFDGKKTEVFGLICGSHNLRVFIVKNTDYDGFILFKIDFIKNNPSKTYLTVLAVMMNLLSYEAAGGAVIEIFKSYLMFDSNYKNYLDRIKICASLFQGLSSTVVHSFHKYFVNAFFKLENDGVHLYCVGHVFSSFFLKYDIRFHNTHFGEIMTVTHGAHNTFVTSIVYQNNN